MTTTFDFRDGRGPVPAHQPPNGGGWVANTARVSTAGDVVTVGPVGSRSGILTAYRTATGIEYATGCFRGSYADLKAACLTTHGPASLHYAAYGRAATALWYLLNPDTTPCGEAAPAPGAL